MLFDLSDDASDCVNFFFQFVLVNFCCFGVEFGLKKNKSTLQYQQHKKNKLKHQQQTKQNQNQKIK
jgi:hypothetical protein